MSFPMVRRRREGERLWTRAFDASSWYLCNNHERTLLRHRSSRNTGQQAARSTSCSRCNACTGEDVGWRKGEGGRGGENVDEGERAAVSFELEPERDGARSGIWLYMQEQSRREGDLCGDFLNIAILRRGANPE